MRLARVWGFRFPGIEKCEVGSVKAGCHRGMLKAAIQEVSI